MYDQIRNDTLFGMLYAVVSALFLAACCYLLFRQGNAFARDVTPPVRLRRWTAAYFAATAVCHLWYMQIFFLTSAEDIMMTDLIGGLLDSVLAVPLVICVMLNMLQDRRRPLWPIPLMIAPFVVGEVYSIATLSYAVIPMLHVYLLLLSICIAIYMFRATRQYGRWLRDNYADLEHKEIRLSLLVLAVFLIFFVIYENSDTGLVVTYLLQVDVLVLIGLLLWRVETLQELGGGALPEEDPAEAERMAASTLIPANIGPLLEMKCEAAQLYLQHDLTLAQLAQTIGTNHSYLSRFFAQQGLTYNAYINGLRVRHFIRLYHDAVSELRIFTAQQLAYESGFHSYSTFAASFKQVTGQTVSAWMRDPDK